MTNANGTTTTIYVSDASLYEVDDIIEYDNDSVARTVTAIDTTNDIVTFASDALGLNSVSGIRIYNWGPNVTDVNENYHLDPNSGCIDAGDPNFSDYSVSDIDGQLRIMDGDGDGNDIVDIGADEFPSTCETCLGDLNGDDFVNNLDLNNMIGWLRYAYALTGEYEIILDDPVTGFLYYSCANMSDALNTDVIDTIDHNTLIGRLRYAEFLYGEYEYECGDPNFDF